MIPPTAHFIWIGEEFCWLNWAALVTAARRGGFQEVVLHHTHDLSAARHYRALAGVPGVVCRRLDETAVIEAANGPRLVDVYRDLSSPAARSNVLRVALLALEGGMYLDTDTVTLQDLSGLRSGVSFFCGAERIAFPAALRRTRDPFAWGGAFLRTAVRDLARRSRDGVRIFRTIERHYATGANNAVLGSAPGHPFVRELLDRMLALSPHGARRRFALGTALLQNALEETSHAGLVVHPPEFFYPLGPELSEHWFRARSRANLASILSPRTHVVHWYASVRTRQIAPKVDPLWLERHGRDRLLAALLVQALGLDSSASVGSS